MYSNQVCVVYQYRRAEGTSTLAMRLENYTGKLNILPSDFHACEHTDAQPALRKRVRYVPGGRAVRGPYRWKWTAAAPYLHAAPPCERNERTHSSSAASLSSSRRGVLCRASSLEGRFRQEGPRGCLSRCLQGSEWHVRRRGVS
ncbi:hypothetical protein NDU88_006971 [Pleurodeles waltl]|uniref:Uncharacterized protein n=1 Tax=Pleurodeles waltl TaxID=8319 RepID=A0AAV7N0T3_PLEWA|nr:hypothetical protein NDU88_006971 [Pleurodeles waltl]